MTETKQVYSAIVAVQGEMAKMGIGKDKVNEMQRYKFRGIDDIYNALAPMLAKHGLCILPRQMNRTTSEQTSKNGGLLFYTVVDVEYDLVAASDGSMHTIRVPGEAMDSGDKATNKAMSAAYKYACLQTFCIPTEGDNDADAKTHEVVKSKPAAQKASAEAKGQEKQPTQGNLNLPPATKKVMDAMKVIEYAKIENFSINADGKHANMIINKIVLKSLVADHAIALEKAFNEGKSVKVQYLETATGNEVVKFKTEDAK